MSTMYRCPGELRHPLRGFLYDQREFAQVADGLATGWHLTLDAAAGVPDAEVAPTATEDATDPPTRAEMLQRAEAIGLKVDRRWSDATLLEKLA